jgi:hypothetical protein
VPSLARNPHDRGCFGAGGGMMAIPGHVLNLLIRTMPCRRVFEASLLWLSALSNILPYATRIGLKTGSYGTGICKKPSSWKSTRIISPGMLVLDFAVGGRKKRVKP